MVQQSDSAQLEERALSHIQFPWMHRLVAGNNGTFDNTSGAGARIWE
jgi:hypothetical protein